ncbi:aspartate semialdehyde dehydrogenase [Halanaerobium saccharolyticum]|uniref:Aspartate-semialdehyde dehydrogenase n=1 Tax=Halanaerobium saccharolyticum TaxID=43595 RepID=A0A4R7Z6N8_9FIRM|nr:aspartate-semialdehyde dehydrogenase [Halanaerobium saccharolyticum]RAK11162.1 aspartate semialdehyde dehydrogenase [Halanaerobium saccharolyticum]TDW07013.1 aspartate semialdehyde dehydrogenase [Halanaerobium saccharolyticum]TDX63778.1 aspartate semialdehyde dehydrogenase [Halanaerobium saccharolyticum]
MKKYNVAVVGATGLVGREMLKILSQRNFPLGQLKLIASERSEGKKIQFEDRELTVESVKEGTFEGIDIALFSAGSGVSKEVAPQVKKAGGIVIDNSNAFRMDPDAPLVVPEVNGEDLKEHQQIIANPNCSTIQMVMLLKPLAEKYGLKRLVINTYQAVSGAGKKAVDELIDQTKAYLSQEEIKNENFNHQIAFNAIPQIDVFLDNDYTKEEMKMVNETHKILHDPDLSITATCVRIPVIFGHGESLNIELNKDFKVEAVKQLFTQTKNVEVVDQPAAEKYPMQIDTEDNDNVLVGRIRRDNSVENGLNLWLTANNLRKGAALNAVQIAEYLIENNLV